MRVTLHREQSADCADYYPAAPTCPVPSESAKAVFPLKAQKFKLLAPSRRFKRRGAAAVEFACVAPLLFLLVLGLMEFGRLMMVQHCLTNAAREGARKAVLANATTSEVNSTINNYMSTAGIDGHTITTSPSPESANAGDAITVTISVPYGQVSWLSFLDLDEEVLGADFFSIGQLQSKTLRADVVMRKEANNN